MNEKDKYGNPVMTVGELRALLVGIPDDTRIAVHGKEPNEDGTFDSFVGDPHCTINSADGLVMNSRDPEVTHFLLNRYIG